jgi:hypothetical protein
VSNPATQTPQLLPAPGAPSAVDLLPSLLRGAVAVGTLAAGVWVTGALSPATQPFMVLGAGAALGATGLAVALHSRVLDRRFAASMGHDPKLIAGRLQGLLAVGMLLKLLTVTVGVLWLRSAGVKFDAVATFAVAFAAAALVCQVVAAGSLVRSTARRGAVTGESLAGAKAGHEAGAST